MLPESGIMHRQCARMEVTMKRRNYSRRQIALICFLSIAMLAAAAILNKVLPPRSEPASATPAAAAEKTSSQTAVDGQASAASGELETGTVAELPDPTEKIATWFQGPKMWKARADWSGKWGDTEYDGSKFGAFGCGLCCLANVYCSLTEYRCSPADMYHYAKKVTEYGGGGAIDWGYMKKTLENIGFTCMVGNKPEKYSDFQQMIQQSKACIVVVSSYDSTCYWQDTPGHYVTLFLYDEATDKVFLGDSGDPEHNRQWVPLKKIYRSLKTSNSRQYLTVTGYDTTKDQWKHTDIGGEYVLPEGWN